MSWSHVFLSPGWINAGRKLRGSTLLRHPEVRRGRGRLAAGRSRFFVVVLAHPSSSFHCSAQDPHPSGETTEVGAGAGGSSCDGRDTPELLLTTHHPLPRDGWVGDFAPTLAGSPEGAVTHPRCHRSLFPGASGSCSSSSPGVQVMLQPRSTASTERGEQHGGGLHLKGSPRSFFFLLLSWSGN